MVIFLRLAKLRKRLNSFFADFFNSLYYCIVYIHISILVELFIGIPRKYYRNYKNSYPVDFHEKTNYWVVKVKTNYF